MALVVAAFGFGILASGLAAMMKGVSTALGTLNVTNAPPELQLLKGVAEYAAWLLSVPIFVAILIAAGYIKQALERS